MEKTRKMMDEIIRRYGFEDKRTIRFCQICEDYEKGKRPFEDVEEAFWTIF